MAKDTTLKGKSFYYKGRTWKIAAWNDTDQRWICRAIDAFDYQQLTEEDVKLCLMLNG